jgi:hypothetical protein
LVVLLALDPVSARDQGSGSGNGSGKSSGDGRGRTRPLRPNGKHGFKNQSTLGEAPQRGSRVAHTARNFAKNVTASPDRGTTVQVRYNATVHAGLISLDEHLDVVDVICTNETLEVSVSNTGLFSDWTVGSIIVGSPLWNCSHFNSSGLVDANPTSFYRRILSLVISIEDNTVATITTAHLTFSECFQSLNVDFEQVPLN